MRFLYALFCYGWSVVGLKQQISRLDSKVSRMHQESVHSAALLRANRMEVDRIREKFEAILSRHEIAQANAERTIRRQDETIEALQEKVHTAEDITIPGLVVSCQIITERYKTEMAILAARQILATPDRSMSE